MHTSDTTQPDPISVLGLSIRPYNALRRAGITTIDELVIILKNGTIQRVRNLGQKGIAEVEEKLLEYVGPEFLVIATEALEGFSNGIAEQITSCSKELSLAAETISSPEPTSKPAWHFHATSSLDISLRLLRILERNHIDLMGQVAQIIEMTSPREAGLGGFGIKHLNDLRASFTNYLENLPKSAFEMVESQSAVAQPEQHINSSTATDDTPLPVQIKRWLASIYNKRDHNVLYWRYGLEQDPMTLEEVGRLTGVTRERIRQIECRILRRLKRPHNKPLIKTVLHRLKTVFDDANGVLTDREITNVLAEVTPPKIRPQGLCALFAEISEEFSRDSKSQTWVWGKYPVASVQAETRKILRNSGAIEQSTLVTQLLEKHPDLEESFVLACLRTLSDIELTKDGFVVPKWTRSQIGVVVQALRQIGQPAHYTEIAKVVNELLPPKLHTEPHNIHARMQRASDVFVWVSSGTYGLAEWGLERSEFYVDIIERVLREHGHPLTIQETLSKVCEVRDCRESTVTMLLGLNERFRAFPGNTYGLSEWREEDYLDESYREKRLLNAITEDELLSRRKPQRHTTRTIEEIDDLLSAARSKKQVTDLPLFNGKKS